ncbi:histidine phosphatase family protein [Aphanothece sacrum]|uniref:Phosphoglycerate mutase n=1 Tax=Aphanothece sacrum FPU1 TaxID=1920663 RepID=A0A401IBT4_APHSA|nr:histidine phosphatase family protein [Aphanothece sacrum]GBF78709.1 phosphoglycerate mutase [Aphanothece sacrum FPU1]GBF84998.1 phosphoglycerate mutase [Aphanothece sacrum FPU3]
MATRVIIVRHGQSSYNAQKRIQGRTDYSVLTEKGIQDAQTLGNTLSLLPIDGIYCSPLQRAKQTAEIIQNCFSEPPNLLPTEQLLEIDLPLWEKLPKQEVKEKFPTEYACWKERPHEFKMVLSSEEENREHFPVLSLYEQVEDFWKNLLSQHQNQTILIVAHNGVNRCLIMNAVGIPPSHYHSIQQSNCGINILNFTGAWGDPVQLESLNQTSHLGIPIPPPRSDNNRLRLLLVRHGETQWNRESRFQGIRDIPLNENGKAQGQKAADFLKDIPLNFGVSSPLLRPKETAEIILQYHPEITLDLQPQLQEICHGLWEGKLETEIENDFPGLLQQWKDAPETVQMPEGENLQQVWDRAIACWQELVKKYSDLNDSAIGIVVAHDAINKVILCYLLGLEPANFWNIKQGNGGVSVIDYPNGIDSSPVLQAINLTTHLGSGVLDKTAAGAL